MDAERENELLKDRLFEQWEHAFELFLNAQKDVLIRLRDEGGPATGVIMDALLASTTWTMLNHFKDTEKFRERAIKMFEQHLDTAMASDMAAECEGEA
jgi:hypothetical protein